MACDPLITDPFLFPRRAANRPALPRIAYRIGRYEDFREAMVRAVDAAPALQAWTHRGGDDPGIALLEGAAIVADILSFYQEHYANEAYLRTAAWRESVADLVRLTGYRLAPGVGGRATFAFEVRGAAPVIIREGLPLKASLRDVPGTAEFQTDGELTAYPHLSRFHLYRRRLSRWTIAAGDVDVELASVGGRSDVPGLAAHGLKAGDRLLLMPDEAMFSTPGTAYSAQAEPQLVTVASLRDALGRVRLTLASGPSSAWIGPVRAYRIGRSFRHFGHNAPPAVLTPSSYMGTVIGTNTAPTAFVRKIWKAESMDDFDDQYVPHFTREELPLDVEAPDLAAGRQVIVQGTTSFTGSPGVVPFAVTRTVVRTRGRSVQWGNLVGASTVLTLDRALVANGAILNEVADIRELRVHEVTGPALTLVPPPGHTSGAFTTGANALWFYGTAAEAAPLAGRRLYLAHDDGTGVEATCTTSAAALSSPDGAPRMWALSFDRPPSPLTMVDFDEDAPAVTVFGNLADATQGKAERDAVLGNGDAGQVFQTFPLPKAPLTYLLDPTAAPPHQPELEVWVGGRLWTPVAALFGRGPLDEVYIVREDAEGRSYVQFGDGETGARLPSGVGNVVAKFRTGAGAHGPMAVGATPSAGERPQGLTAVSLAGLVSGGSDPEDLEKARVAAPGKVQSLGRLVSLGDYETETLAIPGVVAATAAWDLHAGVPSVLLRVLLAAGREGEFEAVREAVASAQRCRGPARHPVIVYQALPRYAFLDLAYVRDPAMTADDVEAGIGSALGLVEVTSADRTGLFGLHARRIGAREYASRIEGRVQQVAGVVWCKVTALGRFAGGVQDPSALVLPPSPRGLAGTLPCAPAELLQLTTAHLTLSALAEPTGVCA